jgi:Cft2 family RNA processing exonuclease
MHKSKRQLGYSSENLSSEGMNSRKKPKTNQSNTLLNYFQSNIAKEPKVVLKQASLETFFKVEKIEKIVKSTTKTEESTESSELVELNCKHEVQTKSHFLKKTAQIEIKEEKTIAKNAFDLLGKNESKTKTEIKSEEVEVNETTSASGKYQKTRVCPFYKRIEGTKIVVDAFSYGDIDNCDAYFLSHFHYDHYSGLSKHFKHKLYCSTITANLVKKQIRVDSKHIVPLELNKFQNFYENDDSVQVCLIDANQ